MWTNNEYEIRRRLDRIQSTTKKYSQSDTLKSISRLSNKIYDEHRGYTKHENHIITVWFLMYLAKEVLTNTTDSRENPMPFDVLIGLSDIYNEISDSIVDKEPNEFGAIFLKLIYEQGQWQIPIRYLMPRNYLIFCGDDEDSINNNLREIFRKYANLDINEFMIITFAASMCAHEKSVFERSYLTNSPIARYKNIFTDEKIEYFLKLVSITNKIFAIEQDKMSIRNRVEKKYEFNLLRSYPIIINNAESYIAPIPRLLIDRCTSNLYYDLIDFYKREYGRPDEFFNIYGHQFERYIGSILCEKYELGAGLFNANELHSNDVKGKKPDWIIIENDNVIIIECKSCRIPLTVIQSGSLEEFRTYFKTHYLKDGKFQFAEVIELYKNKGFKNVHPIMLINDVMTFYNDLNRFFSNEDFLGEIKRYEIQFITLEEVERLIPNLGGLRFSDIINKKINTTHLIHEPFITAFQEYGDFDWETPISLLENVFEKVFYE